MNRIEEAAAKNFRDLHSFPHHSIAAPGVHNGMASRPHHVTTDDSRRNFVLHKCANPDCSSVFRRLSQGKLFLVETDSTAMLCGTASVSRRERPARRFERYWLCDCCSSFLTLTFEHGRGMVTVPLPAGNTHVPGAHLTSIQTAIKGYRAEQSLKGAL
jgi:hypothetical protein